jgi:hypothetical protein
VDELLVFIEEEGLWVLVRDDVEWIVDELLVFVDTEMLLLVFCDDMLLLELELEVAELRVEDGDDEELLRLLDVVEWREVVEELLVLLK